MVMVPLHVAHVCGTGPQQGIMHLRLSFISSDKHVRNANTFYLVADQYCVYINYMYMYMYMNWSSTTIAYSPQA